MANVFDVAEYILKRCGAMSAMKLQKLVYYCQAWSLVWDDEPIFPETIEAWINGPVVPALYQRHKGIFKILPNSLSGNPDALTPEQKDTVNTVCDSYSRLNAQQLSDLTHSEVPFINARKGLALNERGHNAISLADMSEYYQSCVMSKKAKEKKLYAINPKTLQRKSVRKNQTDNLNHICWQFSLMDLSGPYSCSEIKPDEWLLILSKIRLWETMTWNEIEGRRDHSISIESLSDTTKKRLTDLQLDDIDEVFSLHIDGKKRLFGIRDRNIFKVLWWDREHNVCPSLKKHT